MFNLFHTQPDPHLKRVAELLREANLARIEHHAAAEHHYALARMYSERAARLEAELCATFPNLQRPPIQPDQDRLVEADSPTSSPSTRPRLSSL